MPEGQKDAFFNEIMESGGSYVAPGGNDRSSHLFEISLHGVVAYGSSEDEAIRNWKKAARAQAPLVEDDGFITVHPPFPNPRNHAEEIANARAADGGSES
ncbi:MAG: hypothetical protein CSA68_07305 [Rhodobacterales bacterium]|nr:MAG: hypothetical protein CSA68_07305 [Rhodobacterales bacterium]